MTGSFAPTMLIDGPSGAGKTTAAAALGRHTGWRVVHLDDYYPGWDGLAAGSRITAESVLASGADISAAGYYRWNWEENCRGEWVEVDPYAPLIVEGVGALTTETLRAARRRGGVVSWVLAAPRHIRRARALERDPYYAPYWERWAAQEAVHFGRWVKEGIVPDFVTDTARKIRHHD